MCWGPSPTRQRTGKAPGDSKAAWFPEVAGGGCAMRFRLIGSGMHERASAFNWSILSRAAYDRLGRQSSSCRWPASAPAGNERE